MKVKYLCIIVGIVLAAMLFVGAGAADFDGNGWHVDTKWGVDNNQNYDSVLKAPLNSDVQSQAGDKEINSGVVPPIMNEVKEIVVKNPVVLFTMGSINAQIQGLRDFIDRNIGIPVRNFNDMAMVIDEHTRWEFIDDNSYQ